MPTKKSTEMMRWCVDTDGDLFDLHENTQLHTSNEMNFALHMYY